MAMNKKTGMDLRAIRRDQAAIDKLPNKGRVKTKALEKKKGCGCAYHDSNGKCTNYPS